MLWIFSFDELDDSRAVGTDPLLRRIFGDQFMILDIDHLGGVGQLYYFGKSDPFQISDNLGVFEIHGKTRCKQADRFFRV
jgi:hypothetical protein